MILVASALTIPASWLDKAWGETELARLGVDLVLLAGFYVLMLYSRRYWPVWMVGFHVVAVVTHLSTMLAPSVTPQLYRAMGSFWAIPVLLSLLIGVELDRRAAWRLRLSASPSGGSPAHEP